MNEDSVRRLRSSDDSGCICAIAEIDPANFCRVGYRENSHLDVIVAASDFGPGRGSEPAVLSGRSSLVVKNRPKFHWGRPLDEVLRVRWMGLISSFRSSCLA